MRKLFESDPISIIVYGHAHRPQNKVINDILFFNPGRAADSLGIITINGETKGGTSSSR